MWACAPGSTVEITWMSQLQVWVQNISIEGNTVFLTTVLIILKGGGIKIDSLTPICTPITRSSVTALIVHLLHSCVHWKADLKYF